MSILDGQQAPDSIPEVPVSQQTPSLQPPSLEAATREPVGIPVICSLSLVAMSTQSGITIVFYNQVPDKNWCINAPMHQIPIASANLGMSNAKDLMLMLMELIPRHEEQFGEITTPYMIEKGLRETATKQ